MDQIAVMIKETYEYKNKIVNVFYQYIFNHVEILVMHFICRRLQPEDEELMNQSSHWTFVVVNIIQGKGRK